MWFEKLEYQYLKYWLICFPGLDCWYRRWCNCSRCRFRYFVLITICNAVTYAIWYRWHCSTIGDFALFKGQCAIDILHLISFEETSESKSFILKRNRFMDTQKFCIDSWVKTLLIFNQGMNWEYFMVAVVDSTLLESEIKLFSMVDDL